LQENRNHYGFEWERRFIILSIALISGIIVNRKWFKTG
jgi:hypothetical protein